MGIAYQEGFTPNAVGASIQFRVVGNFTRTRKENRTSIRSLAQKGNFSTEAVMKMAYFLVFSLPVLSSPSGIVCCTGAFVFDHRYQEQKPQLAYECHSDIVSAAHYVFYQRHPFKELK